MREIKFRVWDIREKKFAFPSIVCNIIYELHVNKETDVLEHFTLSQFTGLKDKNGKEIYEGDICRVLYTDWGSKDANDPRSIEKYMQDISKIGKVEFEEYEWQFNFGLNKYGETGYGTFHVGAHGRIEIIGNIHENPELLKQ